ncbi:MAG: BamA/TamA family outer membrane protein [Candidatus Marinimicrobia bacterium]|nr:BamA/TamA family outer membrane protein [Candidatus Neomarinimicrobiota bacterium]
MSLKKILIPLIVIGTIFCADNAHYTVNNISISGNESIRKREIKSVLRLKEPQIFNRSDFDRRILKLDAIILKNFYLSRGYLSVLVTDSFFINENNAIDIFFNINEGSQTKLREIKVEGNTVLSTKRISRILGLELNQPYNPIGMNTNMAVLEEEFAQYGKLFTSINIYEAEGDTFEVFVEIDEGPDVYIKDITIIGNDDIDIHFVEREILIESGDLYHQRIIDESEKRILETGIFSFVKITPTRIASNDRMVNLIVELRKFKPRELISEGGFYPFRYKEVSEELPSIGGTLEWRNRNLRRTLRRFSVKSTANIPITENLQEFRYIKFTSTVMLSSQWFAGWRLPTSLSGYYEVYTDFERSELPRIQKYGSKLSYLYRMNERSFIQTGIQWEKFIQPDLVNTAEIEKRTINFDLRWDDTDNPLNPGRGNKITVNATSAGWLLRGNRDFVKIDFGISTYNTIFWRIVLAGRIKYGFMYGWKGDYDPQFDKFYLGGSTSLRGWETFRFLEDDENNPLGKPYRMMTNWELRIPLLWQFGCELFVDGGNLADSFQSLSLSEIQWNGGAGLVYHSPLGPVRIDYAVQLNNVRNSMLIFGVLYAF